MVDANYSKLKLADGLIVEAMRRDPMMLDSLKMGHIFQIIYLVIGIIVLIVSNATGYVLRDVVFSTYYKLKYIHNECSTANEGKEDFTII